MLSIKKKEGQEKEKEGQQSAEKELLRKATKEGKVMDRMIAVEEIGSDEQDFFVSRMRKEKDWNVRAKLATRINNAEELAALLPRERDGYVIQVITDQLISLMASERGNKGMDDKWNTIILHIVLDEKKVDELTKVRLLTNIPNNIPGIEDTMKLLLTIALTERNYKDYAEKADAKMFVPAILRINDAKFLTFLLYNSASPQVTKIIENRLAGLQEEQQRTTAVYS